MSSVLKHLFSGRRFMFWGIVPLGGFLMVLLTISCQDSLKAELIVGALDVVFLLFAVGLWNPRRFPLAVAAVLGSVFVAYCIYVVEEFSSGKRLNWSSEGGFGALHGLVAIGLPCLAGAIQILRVHRRRAKRILEVTPAPVHPR